MPESGMLRAGAHVLPVRVYFEDTDAAGIVYHANYLKFAERARSEMIRLLGLDHTRLVGQEGIAFAVRSCAADFLKPARLDDRLEVRSRVVEVGRASLRFHQSIVRDAAELACLQVRVACVRLKDLKAVAIPDAVMNELKKLDPLS